MLRCNFGSRCLSIHLSWLAAWVLSVCGAAHATPIVASIDAGPVGTVHTSGIYDVPITGLSGLVLDGSTVTIQIDLINPVQVSFSPGSSPTALSLELQLFHDGVNTFAPDDASNSLFAIVQGASPDIGSTGLDVNASGSDGNPYWDADPPATSLVDGDVITGLVLTAVLPNTGANVTGGEVYELYIAATGDRQLTVITAPTALQGDLNDDGFVGISDLNIVLGNWNQNVTPGDPLAGDPSGDGFVGIEDLNTVLGNWNAGTPPLSTSLPEPTSAAILSALAAFVTCRRN